MKLSFAVALVVAAGAGFISLGYEILWARLYNFASGSRAEAFSAMLGSYLVGLACGSLLSRRWQLNEVGDKQRVLRLTARFLVISAALSFLVLPLVTSGISTFEVLYSRPMWTLPLVALAALSLGIVLPVLCHYSIGLDRAAGRRVGWLYFANIVGSGAGSLGTGFFFLDRLGSSGTNLLLLIFGIGLGVLLALKSRQVKAADWAGLSVVIGLAAASPWLHRDLFTRLFYGPAYGPGTRVSQIVETRHGVIIVDTNRLIYGNKIYDGAIDTHLRPGTGMIRPYFVSALHPAPRDVLVIGVSGGAWTQILANNPEVERVTAIEINRGYLEVIRSHPQVSSVLTNPKVTVVIDDGRRWLQRNPQKRFDVIVMNTTFHWREFASALLSKEFLELTRIHLKPGGFVMWNCTGSARAVRTGMEVFPHTLLVVNNCVGSMDPLVIDRARWRRVLEAYGIDGIPVFEQPAHTEALNEVLTFGQSRKFATALWSIRTREDMMNRYGTAEIITDENLGTEYPSFLPELRSALFDW